MTHRPNPPLTRSALWLMSACALATLAACGGGGGDALTPTLAVPTLEAAGLASGATTLALQTGGLPPEVVGLQAQPAFHAAPVVLDTPDDADAMNNGATASQGPRLQAVPAGLQGLGTRRLTLDAMTAPSRKQAMGAGATPAPMATSSVVSTYTPAQIRAAYGLPALPAAGATLSAAQAAQLGAGQTVYIVDAMHDPNAAAELAAFNQKFGLPACATKAIAATAALPLPAAPTAGCEFSVVYSSASATMASAPPAYDAGWATEITLDVQWAHATAPLARIVLIEAPDASLNSLVAAVKLANAMGPGVVSMSFGAAEGNWTASVDAAFTSAGMTYLAATGDSGAAVSWPSVSANVLAVGGTSLSYTGSGARSETGWTGTGGGTSAYTPTPSYQTSAVPGLGAVAHRTVADVAFNADPYSGQYVAVMSQGSSTVNWISAGGTSLSTPQWAGLVAVANAMRASAGKARLGAPHSVLYGQIATVPGTYAGAFADITSGSNGTCATCKAGAGYDRLTGLGTPNATSLLGTLSGSTVAATAPVVTPASISGQVGKALSFTAAATAPNPLSFSLSGAPAGMTINASTGVVGWPTPVAGSYAVTVVAKDSKTALSGQAVYSVSIAAPQAPVVTGSTINGKVGTALSFSVSVTAANPVTYSLTGAPSGMAISTAGVMSWASPVAGSYTVTVVAKDSKTGLTGQGVYTVVVSNGTTVAGPTITAAAFSGTAGTTVSGTITIADPGAASISVSISGVPLGMGLAMNGLTITASWPKAVAGSYSLLVKVTDNLGRSAQAMVPVTVK